MNFHSQTVCHSLTGLSGNSPTLAAKQPINMVARGKSWIIGLSTSPNLKPVGRWRFWETEEKLLVKNLGPDKPEIKISQQITVKDQCYKQSFCRSWFNRKTWLAGCGAVKALFCFPCILFRSYKCDSTWTKTGLTDLKRLSEWIKKHDGSKVHMKTAWS